MEEEAKISEENHQYIISKIDHLLIKEKEITKNDNAIFVKLDSKINYVVGEKTVIVSFFEGHIHFDKSLYEKDFLNSAIDFIEMLLTEQLKIEKIYKGKKLKYTKTFALKNNHYEMIDKNIFLSFYFLNPFLIIREETQYWKYRE
jgi:hypothetical protein